MKKLISALCAALCLFTFAGCTGADGGNTGNGGGNGGVVDDGGNNGGNNGGGTVIEEGKLTIGNVYGYYGYNPVKIETKVDGKVVEGLDLYYDIIDESVCTIENGYAKGLKVGSTQVYAQTLGGQEVGFTVTVRDAQEFLYNAEVLTREEERELRFGNVKNPTLFFGDSFFDEKNFWTTFYNDFEDLNCITVGISGSQTQHWYSARDRLIKAWAPKNIVIHIGTNDINDNNINLTVDQYYAKITTFLELILTEYPQTPVYYFGIENRNGDQAGKNAYSQAVTEKIKTEFAVKHENFHYFDTPAVFNADPDVYVSADNIHPSKKGYELYVKMLKENVNF